MELKFLIHLTAQVVWVHCSFLNLVCIIIWMFTPSKHQACMLSSETPMDMINHPIKKPQHFSSYKEGFVGKVIVGSKQEPLCIHGSSTITVSGAMKRPMHVATCLVEQAAHSNLPCGIIVNRCLVHPKVKSVPLILVNINSKNMCIRQPPLATELFEIECHSWEYDTSLDRYRDEVMITFWLQTSTDIDASLQEINVQMEDMHGSEEPEKMSSHPVFGPCPQHHSPGFDFQAELKHLPFTLNSWKVPLEKEQQSRFLDIIYDNQKVFSLHDDDLTTMDKPIYLPHRTILRQLQG